MDRSCEACVYYVQVSSARGICRKDEIVRHEVAASFVCGDFAAKVVDDGGCYDEEEVYS